MFLFWILFACATMCFSENKVGQPISVVLSNHTRDTPFRPRPACKHGIQISPIDTVIRPRKQLIAKRTNGSCSGNLIHVPIRSRNKDKCTNENVKFAVINARSIANKIDEIKHIIDDGKIDILAITETWLSPNSQYETSEIVPSGFEIIHVDREGRKGGGVAVIYRQELAAVQKQIGTFVSFEHCVVDFNGMSNKLRLAIIYRPPSSETRLFLRELTSLFEDQSLSGPQLLIAGDVNINLSTSSPLVKDYLQILDSFSMQQHVRDPTHVKGGILDHVISSSKSKLIVSEIVVGDLLSDHHVLSTTLSFSKPSPHSRTVTFRKIANINVQSFRSDIKQTNIYRNHSKMDLDSLISSYNTEMQEIFDKHAPKITRQLRNKRREPWINDEVKGALRVSRSIERKWRKNRQNHEYEVEFNRARTVYSSLLRQSKSAHFRNILDTHSRDQGKLFREMNKIMNRTQCKVLPDHTDSKELADRFCQFFQDKIKVIRDQFEEDISEEAFRFDSRTPLNFPRLDTFVHLTEDNVRKIIMKTKSKSCELDPLPTALLKLCITELCPIITRIVNASLDSRTMPAIWKRAIVRPLIKKPSLEPILKNYRPVSNLAYISKVIEEAVEQQIAHHIETYSLADPLQSAYKRAHSTETALLKMCNDILIELDNGRAVCLGMLDLSAAFDTVDHGILLRRLKETFNITGNVAQWLESYLSNRTVQVCIDGTYSDPATLDCSLPQGSQMGPKRYSDYVRPMGKLLSVLQLMYHCYADDTQVGKSFAPKIEQSQVTAVQELQHGIKQISKWMHSNRLKLNREKTEFIVFVSKHDKKHIKVNELRLESDTIPSVPVVRNLGVHLDEHLLFEQHIAYLCKVCFMYLGWIKKIRHLLTFEATKTLVHALIMARLDYCNSLFTGLPQCVFDRLQRIMNVAARLIAGARRRDRITPILKRLHWLPVKERSQFKTLTLIFKSVNGTAPAYLCDIVRPHSPKRTLRSNSTNTLQTIRTKKQFGARSFQYAGAKMWNELPENIKRSESLVVFKKKLKTHMFIKVYGNDN